MPSRVLDVGCGSGILAIAALQLGAGRATGYDTEPLAVRAAAANAALNGLEGRIVVREGTLPVEAEAVYDVVLANLVAAVLIELAPRLATHARPGGTLLASGIIHAREAEVCEALEAAGFRRITRLLDGEWVSLHLERAR